jgi:hypothetical protein
VRKLFRTWGVVLGGAVGVAILAVPAAATFTTPSSNPFTVPGDGSGNPVPYDVVVNNFAPGAHVFLEQCDGVPSSSPGYDPAQHCDSGTSGSAATADANGVAHFPASDINLHVNPFKGPGPSGTFDCLAPTDSNIADGNPQWGNTSVNPAHTSCQLRASTNDTQVTTDQQYISLVLPSSGTAVTPETPYAIILPVSAIAVGGALFLIRKRRASHASA